MLHQIEQPGTYYYYLDQIQYYPERKAGPCSDFQVTWLSFS